MVSLMFITTMQLLGVHKTTFSCRHPSYRDIKSMDLWRKSIILMLGQTGLIFEENFEKTKQRNFEI